MDCKVADFGLSRELETTDSSRGEYVTQVSTLRIAECTISYARSSFFSKIHVLLNFHCIFIFSELGE